MPTRSAPPDTYRAPWICFGAARYPSRVQPRYGAATDFSNTLSSETSDIVLDPAGITRSLYADLADLLDSSISGAYPRPEAEQHTSFVVLAQQADRVPE